MRPWILSCMLAALPLALSARAQPAPATDLDGLMAEVVARRDDNWKKLQQYILNERQTVTVTGPDGLRLYGTTRDYHWYVKEGFLIRSPLTANGIGIGEAERRRYEARYLQAMKKRDDLKAQRDAEGGVATAPAETVGDLLSQQAEPSFVSAAYFLKFTLDPGRYAFAGRETLDGREVLRIEYYPARLFNDDEHRDSGDADRDEARRRRREARDRDDTGDDDDARIQQQMNRTSLVTLWVLRDERQIVRYDFDNVGWDFLPGRSVARIDDLSASMRMHEAFPGVWLPQAISARAKLGTALGQSRALYDVAYSDYRQAGVTVRVK